MMSPLSGLARFFDAAKKDLEGKSLTKVGDLIGSAPAVKKEEPAPSVVEAPKVEEAPVTEVPVAEEVPATPEVPSEEAPAA